MGPGSGDGGNYTHMSLGSCHLSSGLSYNTSSCPLCFQIPQTFRWGLLLFLCSSTREKEKEPLSWDPSFSLRPFLTAQGIRQGALI